MRVKRKSISLVILTLLPAVGSLSLEGPSRKYERPRRPSRLPMSSQVAPPLTTQPRQERKQMAKRRRKAPGAPLVDSALLRFISKQKKQTERQQQQLNGDRTSNVSTEVSPSEAEVETSTSSRTDESLNGSITPSGIDKTSNQLQPPLDVSSDQLNPWMGQYNRNRVAQKLVSLGCDEESASRAGEKVQSHLLVRTARRRIREFLRERDSQWHSPTLAPNSANSPFRIDDMMDGRASRRQEPQPPEYGFDDVVELLLGHGLTGKDICAILTHSPSLALMMPRRPTSEVALTSTDKENVNGVRSARDPQARFDDSLIDDSSTNGETLEETMNRSFDGLLCSTLKLRKYDARKVLRGCPGLLSMRGSKSAVQVVAIMSKLGVSTSSMAKDKAALPLLLSRSPAALFRLVAFLSSDSVRMPINKIGPLLRRPQSLDILNAVVPVPRLQAGESVGVDYEGTTDDISTDENVLEALVSRTNDLRRKRINEVYKKMTTTARTLRGEIGTSDLGKVISAYPSVLLLDAEEQILPIADFLMDELRILEGDLPKVLQLYPILLGRDIADMEKVVSFLDSLGISKESQASIFRAFPSLLTMNVEKQMLPVIEYLRSIGIENVGRFVTRLPTVLGYSVELDLEPKWKFLSQVSMYANFELSKFPAYFSYPFERVIKTRYEYLASKGFPTDLIPVDQVLRSGDKDFATKVAADEDGGKKFFRFVEERKSASQGWKKRRRPRYKKSTKDM